MLSVNELAPVSVELTFRGFGLTHRVGRLVARLLTKYGELLSDELGVTADTAPRSVRGDFQMVFPRYGMLHVTGAWAAVRLGHPGDEKPTSEWVSEKIEWGVELLEEVIRVQKKTIDGINMQCDWLFWEDVSDQEIARHLGIEHALGGFLTTSTDIAIEYSRDVQSDELFTAECTARIGALNDYDEPNIGVQLKYFSPSKAMDDLLIDFDGAAIRRIFAEWQADAHSQLGLYFPAKEAK